MDIMNDNSYGFYADGDTFSSVNKNMPDNLEVFGVEVAPYDVNFFLGALGGISLLDRVSLIRVVRI